MVPLNALDWDECQNGESREAHLENLLSAKRSFPSSSISYSDVIEEFVFRDEQ